MFKRYRLQSTWTYQACTTPRTASLKTKRHQISYDPALQSARSFMNASTAASNASSNAASTTTAQPNNKGFPFCQLPPELRNMIYFEVLGGCRINITSCRVTNIESFRLIQNGLPQADICAGGCKGPHSNRSGTCAIRYWRSRRAQHRKRFRKQGKTTPLPADSA